MDKTSNITITIHTRKINDKFITRYEQTAKTDAFHKFVW